MTLRDMIAALAGYVGARILGAGLGLLTQLVLTRALPPADVATVFLAMSGAAILSLLMNGGETQLASTHLPKLLTFGRQRALAAFHGYVAHNMLAVYFLLVAAFLLAHAAGLLQAPVETAFLTALVCAPFAGLARYNSMIANSQRWFPLSYIPDFIVRPALFLLSIAAFIVLGLQSQVYLVLVAFAASVWAVTLGQTLLLKGQHLRIRHLVANRRRYGQVLRPRSVALLVVGVTSFAFADIVMLLAGFLLTPEDAAVAGVAVRLAAIAGFILQAAQLYVLPDFTEALARGNSDKANTVLWHTNGLSLLVILTMLVGAVALGRYALAFFGEVYVTGAMLLVLFIAGQSIRALGGMNQSLLAIQGHQVRTAVSCLFALIILVLASVVLTRQWGLIGLGYAAIAAELTWIVALSLQAQSLCGRRADLLWLARNA
jgi:O-antigen/teichoic acid export membrane protein